MTIENKDTAKKTDYTVEIDGKKLKCTTTKACFGTHVESNANCISCAKKTKLVYKCCIQSTLDKRIAENAKKAATKKAEIKKIEKSDIEIAKISDCKRLVDSLRVIPEMSKDEQTELEKERVKQDILYLELSKIIDQETDKIQELDKIDLKIAEIQKMQSSAEILKNEDMLSMIKTTLKGSVELQTSIIVELQKIRKEKEIFISKIHIKIVPTISDLQNQIKKLQEIIALQKELVLSSGKVKKKKSVVKSGNSTTGTGTGIAHSKYMFIIPRLVNDADAVLDLDNLSVDFSDEFKAPLASALKFVKEANGSLRHKLSKGKIGTLQTRMFDFLNGKTSEVPEGDKGTINLCKNFNVAWTELVSSGIIKDIEKS